MTIAARLLAAHTPSPGPLPSPPPPACLAVQCARTIRAASTHAADHPFVPVQAEHFVLCALCTYLCYIVLNIAPSTHHLNLKIFISFLVGSFIGLGKLLISMWLQGSSGLSLARTGLQSHYCNLQYTHD